MGAKYGAYTEDLEFEATDEVYEAERVANGEIRAKPRMERLSPLVDTPGWSRSAHSTPKQCFLCSSLIVTQLYLFDALLKLWVILKIAYLRGLFFCPCGVLKLSAQNPRQLFPSCLIGLYEIRNSMTPIGKRRSRIPVGW